MQYINKYALVDKAQPPNNKIFGTMKLNVSLNEQ